MTHKRHVIIRFTLLFLLVLTALGTAFAQAPTFRVAVMAESNSQLARGARLVVRQLNAEGGVEGADGTRFQLELAFFPANSVDDVPAVIEQIAQANVIAIIGPESSELAAALIPSLLDLNVPVLTPAREDSLIVDDPTEFMFRTRAPRFFTERALAEYLITDVGISTVDVIQFDVEATVSVLGFNSAYQTLGGVPNPAVLVNTQDLIASTASQIATNNPPAVVTYGDPALAGQFYIQLRSAGYAGQFTHPNAVSSVFRGGFPPEVFFSTLSSMTWSPGVTDAISSNFISGYARTFAEVPNEVAAAGADAMLLLSEAIGLPGVLQQNLLQLDGVTGIQGTLSPAGQSPGETSNNVVVTQLNEFGAPEVVARFAGETRVELAEAQTLLAAPVPTATPLPDGVFVTITSQIQNVRSGPSTDFGVIGQLQQGEQLEVTGANIDFSWLVIDFRGRQGWIANLSNLNEIIGDLNTLSIVEAPPTPTPPPFTAPPQPTIVEIREPDIVIQAASVNPNPIRVGDQFTLNVTVANQGALNAGPFAVSVTMPPDNIILTANVSGLSAGQSTTVNLNGTLNSTGSFSTIITADPNNQVNEGTGENNNGTFTFSYRVEGLSDEGTVTLEDDRTLRFEDNFEIRWDDPDIEGVDGTTVGIITGSSFSNVQADQVNANATLDEVTVEEEDIVGFLGEDGDRGIVRIQDIDGSRVTLRYKIFD